ncbi:hypothetical protein Hdeb2414_s1268g01001621 [Helianthus debilis subsp. tardiflorus]
MYQEAEVEADDDTCGDGDGSKFKITEMSGESLCDDEHGIGSYSAEDGWANYVP